MILLEEESAGEADPNVWFVYGGVRLLYMGPTMYKE